MANVKEYLEELLSKRYGKDVRQAIHDSIDAINTQVTESEQGVKDSALAAEQAKEEAESAAGNAVEQVTLAANQVELAAAQVILAEQAKEAAEKAASSINIGVATMENVGLVKPDGITTTIDPDGTIHANQKEETEFAKVAKTGSYNDLTDKPAIPAAQVQTDWNATSGVSAIKNKPELTKVATSGSYNDLSDKPTIPTVGTAGKLNYTWDSANAILYLTT